MIMKDNATVHSSRPLSIVLAGGGTAGHVNPLLSIAQHIRRLAPQSQISVIGTAVGLESRLVPDAGFELDTIEKVPFPRSVSLSTLAFPGKWMKQIAAVKKILRARHTDVVVGVGGYAAAPVYWAAHSMGIPVIVHEQNATAGMANKLGAMWAQFIGTTYDNCGLRAGSHGVMERVGLPLRDLIAQRAEELVGSRAEAKRQARVELGLDSDVPVIAVTGGSLGAQSINTAVANAAPDLLKVAQIVHLTGAGKSSAVRTVVSTLVGEDAIGTVGDVGGDYHIAEYCEAMDAVMAAADVVICRSGAGTVAELSALGVPAVYVPLPIGNGEQRFNAQPVVDAGGAILINDDDFTASWIVQHVISLISRPERLESMSKAAWQYGLRDAADKMARVTLDVARTGAFHASTLISASSASESPVNVAHADDTSPAIEE